MKSILGEAILKCNDDDLTKYKDSNHFLLKVEANKGKLIIAYQRRTRSFWWKRLVSFKGCTN